MNTQEVQAVVLSFWVGSACAHTQPATSPGRQSESVADSAVGVDSVATDVTAGNFPRMAAPTVFEGMETWGTQPPSHDWSKPGEGYQRNNWKNGCTDMAPSLDTQWKVDGQHSLRFDYNVQTCGTPGKLGANIVATGHFFDLGKRSTSDGIQFTIRPDGAGRPFDYWILDAPHDIRDAFFVPTGTDPVVVYLPWKVYKAAATDTWVNNVIEEVWEVGVPPYGKGWFQVDQQALFKGDAELPGACVIPAAPVATPFRVDAGNYLSGTKDHNGVSWRADIGYCAKDNIVPSDQVKNGAIKSAQRDAVVFESARVSPAAYFLPIANGTYVVNLLFAEVDPQVNAEGQRVFDVRVNDKLILDLDVYKMAGGKALALRKSLRVTVSEGFLNVVFTVKKGVPLINGIEIL